MRSFSCSIQRCNLRREVPASLKTFWHLHCFLGVWAWTSSPLPTLSLVHGRGTTVFVSVSWLRTCRGHSFLRSFSAFFGTLAQMLRGAPYPLLPPLSSDSRQKNSPGSVQHLFRISRTSRLRIREPGTPQEFLWRDMEQDILIKFWATHWSRR